VGRLVTITPAHAAQMHAGLEIELHTELVVREDSLTLFGFETEDDRGVFRTLLTVSGVGPKLAMAVLGVLGADGLRTAVAAQDAKALTAVPGIGAKGAARMLLELTGKLPAGTAGTSGAPVAPEAVPGDQVVEALVGLGWKEAQAERVVEDARAAAPDATVPVLLKDALRRLGGPR
jgi:Holliday junction DNA helicase RuvA